MKYFLHDSNSFNDEKVTMLFIKFGYEGLGLFYTALEKLAQQEKPMNTCVLKHQLNVGKKLNKIWLFMESIDLLSSNNGETFNKQLLNFSKKYQVKKEKNTKRISEWRKNQEDSEKVTRYESVSNTSKVKLSKVKESKEVLTLRKNMKDFFLSHYKKTTGLDYVIAAKENTAMKQIHGKINTLLKNSGKDISGEIVETTFIHIVTGIKDNWIIENLSIPIINSKFNEIVNSIKNGKTKQIDTKGGATDKEIARIIAEKFGTDSEKNTL